MPYATQSSVVDTINSAGSHTRDSRRSSNDWESRGNGQWYKRDYYQLQAPTMAASNNERGTHVLGNIFTGCYGLCFNETWLREKNIERVLVLGTGSGVSVRDTLKLRVVDITERNLDSCFDSIATLLTEASNENANTLIVDRDQRTFVPSAIVAHLLSLGWLLDAAVRRIEGIYKFAFSEHQLNCLRRWDQTLKSRRVEIGARSRSASVPLPPPAQFSSTVISGGSVPAISALSVINPMYYASRSETFATALAPLTPIAPVTPLVAPLTPLVPPIAVGPAISAVSLVNPLWSTVAAPAPLISATSLINPYWNSVAVAAPVVQPVIQPVIHETIATSVVNPRFNEVVATRSVSNPVWHERHMTAEFSGRRVSNTPAPLALPPPAQTSGWHSRSVPAASERFDTSSNPLARHPLTPRIGHDTFTSDRASGNNAALMDAVENTAFNTARMLQRRPRDMTPDPEYHMVRDITTFG